MRGGDDIKVTLNEIYATNGNLYFKIDGIETTVTDLVRMAIDVAGDEGFSQLSFFVGDGTVDESIFNYNARKTFMYYNGQHNEAIRPERMYVHPNYNGEEYYDIGNQRFLDSAKGMTFSMTHEWAMA